MKPTRLLRVCSVAWSCVFAWSATCVAQERVRMIAQIAATPTGAIEVLARSSDGLHIGLTDGGVLTYNCGTTSFEDAAKWSARAHTLADTVVRVAKNEFVVLAFGHFPGCGELDLTREAAGRAGSFHFNSSTDYGVGAINLRIQRRAFLHFLAAIDTAMTAARGMGVVGAAPMENQTYFEYQVEKPAMTAPGSPSPRYPDILKSAGVKGEVVVSFTVDTTGHAILSTLHILTSTNESFAEAVRTALPIMRFIPAQIGGRNVMQLVQQPFIFSP